VLYSYGYNRYALESVHPTRFPEILTGTALRFVKLQVKLFEDWVQLIQCPVGHNQIIPEHVYTFVGREFLRIPTPTV